MNDYIMNRESLKRHCEAMCKKFKDVPTSGIYGEHKLVLDLLEQTEWVSVKDRLPETRNEVLVFLANGNMTIASYNDHILPFFDEPIGWQVDVKRFVLYFCSDDVIAWQPLPEPYKESEANE